MNLDIYARVTARVVQALESGVAPWVRPWTGEIDPVPINATTRRPYRGINNLVLQLEAASRGYERNVWMTFRQANELGARVRRGETGAPIVFWRLRRLDVRGEVYPERGDEELDERVIPLIRAYTVFNVAQIDGLPPEMAHPLPSVPSWQAHEVAEMVIEASGADIRQGGFRAYYQPAEDYVQIPPSAYFPEASAWYSTLLHELAHWTGHKTRLDRQLTTRFGTEAYAMEELVAELASAFLCAACRIDGRLQHTEYIGSWLKALRHDKRAIFVASAKAQQAADFLLNPQSQVADQQAVALAA